MASPGQFPVVEHLENATDAEISRIIDVLVEAFNPDPFSLILLGGNLSLAPIELGANVRACAIGGQIHIVRIGPASQDIVGVALWFPPGQSVFSTEEQRAAGWNQFLVMIPKELRTFWTDHFAPTVQHLSTSTLGPGRVLSAWHLHLFAVNPEHQGKGYGRLLFQYVDKQALSAGAGIVLETSNDVDVTIYERLGCEVRAETRIENYIGEGRVILMTKYIL